MKNIFQSVDMAKLLAFQFVVWIEDVYEPLPIQKFETLESRADLVRVLLDCSRGPACLRKMSDLNGLLFPRKRAYAQNVNIPMEKAQEFHSFSGMGPVSDLKW